MAYQMLDDVWGIWGKESATDIMKKKKTIPVIYALEHAETEDHQTLKEIYTKDNLEPEDAQLVGDLTALENAQHLGVPNRRGKPEGPLRVKADSVRGNLFRIKLGPDTAAREGTVRLDVKGGKASGKRLSDDEGASIRGNDTPIWEGHLVGHDARVTIWRYQHNLSKFGRS